MHLIHTYLLLFSYNIGVGYNHPALVKASQTDDAIVSLSHTTYGVHSLKHTHIYIMYTTYVWYQLIM